MDWLGTEPRLRKRPRASGGHDLENCFDRFEVALGSEPADAGQLFFALQRLNVLQSSLERRLSNCSINNLTPYEAAQFIYSRKVRLLRIVRNGFEDSNEENASSTDSQVDAAADGSAIGGPQSGCSQSRVETDERRKNTVRNRQIAAHLDVGRRRISVICRVDIFPLTNHGSAKAYILEALLRPPQERTSGSSKIPEVQKPQPKRIFHCNSMNEASTSIDWDLWQELQDFSGQFDQRSRSEFARAVMLQVFAELRRKFASGSADSDESDNDGFSLIATLMTCEMMAQAALPSQSSRLADHSRQAPGGSPPREAVNSQKAVASVHPPAERPADQCEPVPCNQSQAQSTYLSGVLSF